MRERPLGHVPRPVVWLLALCLGAQIAWRVQAPAPSARAEALPAPPTAALLRLAALGDDVALARLLMLRLQAYDDQPGVRIPFRDLDYARVEAWLERLLELDPQSQYPLLCAVRIYAAVPDEAKKRAMYDFAYRAFLRDPNRRWRWLAESAIAAKHQLRDLPLARKYAAALRLYATGADVPSWAKQMEIFLLADMNEIESAKVLLGGLLASGQIRDPHEMRFLADELERLERRAAP
jgi:hypothetical protein